MNASQLHVVTAIFNPLRWQSRLALYRDFEQRVLDEGAKLTTVECALGDRPFELDNPHVNHVKVRTSGLMFNKENLINLGTSRLPGDARYICWADADIRWRKSGWAGEAVHYLQQYKVIQPWSDVYDLGPQDEHVAHWRSFLNIWWHDKQIVPGGPYEFAHPGYVWCATRQALDWLGGLIETAALGAGDHHMALALIGKVDLSMPGGVTSGYRRPLEQWQERALRHVNYDLGYMQGWTIEHCWHGRPTDRQYVPRWQIIVRNQFDPAVDLKRNTWGVLELTRAKPRLVHDLDVYFRQRNEDGNLI
jgi:hypothetical protein